MISRNRSAPPADAMSIEPTTSANSTVTCLYSAGVPDGVVGDPHSSQNFAVGRSSAPHLMQANAAVMPAPPIPGYDLPDRPKNRALSKGKQAYRGRTTHEFNKTPSNRRADAAAPL